LGTLYECTQTVPFSGVLNKGKTRYSKLDYSIMKLSYLTSVWYIDFYAERGIYGFEILKGNLFQIRCNGLVYLYKLHTPIEMALAPPTSHHACSLAPVVVAIPSDLTTAVTYMSLTTVIQGPCIMTPGEFSDQNQTDPVHRINCIKPYHIVVAKFVQVCTTGKAGFSSLVCCQSGNRCAP